MSSLTPSLDEPCAADEINFVQEHETAESPRLAQWLDVLFGPDNLLCTAARVVSYCLTPGRSGLSRHSTFDVLQMARQDNLAINESFLDMLADAGILVRLGDTDMAWWRSTLQHDTPLGVLLQRLLLSRMPAPDLQHLQTRGPTGSSQQWLELTLCEELMNSLSHWTISTLNRSGLAFHGRGPRRSGTKNWQWSHYVTTR
jgi:hypothetical protein